MLTKTRIMQIGSVSRKLCHQYGIITPPDIALLKYSRMGKQVNLGFYNRKQNTVELNRYTLELWTLKQITETVQHELIHALCYQKYGDSYDGAHDRRFRETCKDMGICKKIASATKKDIMMRIRGG